jgi:hypothetical protein
MRGADEAVDRARGGIEERLSSFQFQKMSVGG